MISRTVNAAPAPGASDTAPVPTMTPAATQAAAAKLLAARQGNPPGPIAGQIANIPMHGNIVSRADDNRDTDTVASRAAAGHAVARALSKAIAGDPMLSATLRAAAATGTIRADEEAPAAPAPAAAPAAAPAPAKDGEPAGHLARILGALDEKLTSLCGRMDKLEAAAAAKPASDTYGSSAAGAPGDNPGAPQEPLALDAAADSVAGIRTSDRFALYQSAADQVFSLTGMRAPSPLAGESLLAYRIRLLKPLQAESRDYKQTDLRRVADASAFDSIEKNILQQAADSWRSPSTVPAGHLREILTTRLGRETRVFLGAPSSWMRAFQPAGRKAKINRPAFFNGIAARA